MLLRNDGVGYVSGIGTIVQQGVLSCAVEGFVGSNYFFYLTFSFIVLLY